MGELFKQPQCLNGAESEEKMELDWNLSQDGFYLETGAAQKGSNGKKLASYKGRLRELTDRSGGSAFLQAEDTGLDGKAESMGDSECDVRSLSHVTRQEKEGYRD